MAYRGDGVGASSNLYLVSPAGEPAEPQASGRVEARAWRESEGGARRAAGAAARAQFQPRRMASPGVGPAEASAKDGFEST